MAEYSDEIRQAHKQVVDHFKNSYAPYSKLNVGAGLKLKGQEKWVFGVNVENASFGATICAERSAVIQAVSRYGSSHELESIIIASNSPSGLIPPCGMCLQVLQEFAQPELNIYLGDQNEVLQKTTLAALMPRKFLKGMLP